MADAAASAAPAPAVPVAWTPSAGLSSGQVAERCSRGLTNAGGERTSRSVAEILRANIFTRFNLLLGVLLAVILVWGEWKDALFGIVLVANALIGIGQELRAKRTLDRLAVLSAPRVRVIRDGVPREIAVEELVADDLVDLRAGDELVADGVVRESAGLQADESLLTGESEPVDKRAGDRLLSGSFVVAGSGGYQATGVGAEAYARKLAAQARRFTVVRSELVAGINQILRYVTWALPPVAVLVVVSQLHTPHQTTSQRATSTVAALVGMVPQGLVLLTSIAFGAAAVTLARRRVLVQQLPAVEGLARVDVVCLDKTGTLTDGTIAFDRLIRLDDAAPAEAALGALAADENRNATLGAIGRAFPLTRGWARQDAVPFSSARKWSAASFAGHGAWVLGAPEMVLPGSQDWLLTRAADLAAGGRRVLVLARADGPLDGQALPPGLRAVAARSAARGSSPSGRPAQHRSPALRAPRCRARRSWPRSTCAPRRRARRPAAPSPAAAGRPARWRPAWRCGPRRRRARRAPPRPAPASSSRIRRSNAMVPSVSVPVLSKHTTSTRARPSTAGSCCTRTRRRASVTAATPKATLVSRTSPCGTMPTSAATVEVAPSAHGLCGVCSWLTTSSAATGGSAQVT